MIAPPIEVARGEARDQHFGAVRTAGAAADQRKIDVVQLPAVDGHDTGTDFHRPLCQVVDRNVEHVIALDLQHRGGGGEVRVEAQQEGEVAFRRMETEAVRKSAENKGVIALGGGALMNSENRETLLTSGTVVYLKATADTLANRLQARTENRPVLSGEGRLEDRIAAILNERSEVYSMAHWTVDTDEMPPQKIAGTIYSLVMYGLFMDAIDD